MKLKRSQRFHMGSAVPCRHPLIIKTTIFGYDRQQNSAKDCTIWVDSKILSLLFIAVRLWTWWPLLWLTAKDCTLKGSVLILCFLAKLMLFSLLPPKKKKKKGYDRQAIFKIYTAIAYIKLRGSLLWHIFLLSSSASFN